ncbi:A/G-specific adenine glycosylase [bacterium]|nr:A/G-specific adenine glycosylase [bacterium]
MIQDCSKFQARLLEWYQKNKRDLPWRQTENPYFIWISEIMLQQTQVKTVIPYYFAFINEFPTILSLAEANLTRVLKLWEGLGYYSRARNLHKASKIVVSEFEGVIPDQLEDFKSLPGVGSYTAAAVLSIAFHKSLSVVDGNVKRVLARLFMINDPVNKPSAHQPFEKTAASLMNSAHPSQHNQAMMELGALICVPVSPLCDTCPVGDFCESFKNKITGQFPKRQKAKAKPAYHIAVGVVRKENKLLITRRKPEGLLGGLWEFPGGKVEKEETAEQACLREIREEVGLTVSTNSFVKHVKHEYSHFKIAMDVFICDYISGTIKLKGPVDHRWIEPSDIDRFPFPKANHKFIPTLLSILAEQ